MFTCGNIERRVGRFTRPTTRGDQHRDTKTRRQHFQISRKNSQDRTKLGRRAKQCGSAPSAKDPSNTPHRCRRRPQPDSPNIRRCSSGGEVFEKPAGASLRCGGEGNGPQVKARVVSDTTNRFATLVAQGFSATFAKFHTPCHRRCKWFSRSDRHMTVARGYEYWVAQGMRSESSGAQHAPEGSLPARGFGANAACAGLR